VFSELTRPLNRNGRIFYLLVDQGPVAPGAWVQVLLDDPERDPLNEYVGAPTYGFSPRRAGTYLMSASSFHTLGICTHQGVKIVLNGADAAFKIYNNNSTPGGCETSVLRDLTVGDLVSLESYVLGGPTNNPISSAHVHTYLNIVRVN